LKLVDNEERKTKYMINGVILAIALFGMSRRDYVFQRTSFAEKFIIDIMAPVQSMVISFERGVSSYVEDYVMNLNASKENKHLKTTIAELQNEMFSYQEQIERIGQVWRRA